MTTPQTHRRVTGLSGNEIYCLSRLGMRPGQLCVGNSVMALGIGRGIGAGLSTLGGGEVEEVTKLVHDARERSFSRLQQEAKKDGGSGITGVSFDVVNHGGNLEFISIGSTTHTGEPHTGEPFSTSGDAQQLYCQMDAGFKPLHFVFGNVAYSIGVGGGIAGRFRSLVRGEVTEFSNIFDRTRHLAIRRITAEGKRHGANAVIGIKTTITPLLGTQEMVMIGTAAHHPLLGDLPSPVTSDMTPEETWNLCNLGYMPLQLVMGVSVYSLGFAGGLGALLGSLAGGELGGLSELLYDARNNALARIERDAEKCGADEVVGVKTSVYDLGGGLVEFMAIGTAVKKVSGAGTQSQALLPQAIIQDRETLVDTTQGFSLSQARRASATRAQNGPLAFVMSFIFFVIYVLLKLHK